MPELTGAAPGPDHGCARAIPAPASQQVIELRNARLMARLPSPWIRGGPPRDALQVGTLACASLSCYSAQCLPTLRQIRSTRYNRSRLSSSAGFATTAPLLSSAQFA